MITTFEHQFVVDGPVRGASTCLYNMISMRFGVYLLLRMPVIYTLGVYTGIGTGLWVALEC